jgi:hypothetical protein
MEAESPDFFRGYSEQQEKGMQSNKNFSLIKIKKLSKFGFR